MAGTIIRLPEDIADDLLASGDAQVAFDSRGSMADVLHVAVESINSGSALVSVIAGGAALRRVARAVLDRRRNDEDRVVVHVQRGGATRSLQIDPADPDAESLISDFLRDSAPPMTPAI